VAPTYIPELLIAALKAELDNEQRIRLIQLAASEWEELLELAIAQAVFPILWHRLKAHGLTNLIPPATSERMQKLSYSFAVRNLRLYHGLGMILARLREQNIRVILLKGAHLAGAVYSHQALRSMSDIDLLFMQADIPAVVEILSELGYQPTNQVVLEANFVSHHHLPPFTNTNSVANIEIHWTITRLEKSYTIAVDELWARAQPIRLANGDALGLSPEDLLLHICEHATYQHMFQQGLRFLCDIDAIVRRYATVMDWRQVEQRAQQWGWKKGVHLALMLANQLLETPIPGSVLQQLQPDHFHQKIINIAINQIFADNTTNTNFSSTFAQLWHVQSFYKKVQILWSNIFLPPERLILYYPIRLESRSLYFYYLVRCKDLLVDYGGITWRLLRSDPQLTESTRDRNALLQWFEQTQ
jgi:hypothetical protein